MTAPYTAADWVFAVVAVLLLAGLAGMCFVLDVKLGQARRENARLAGINEALADARHAVAEAESVLDRLPAWWLR